ncbi:MAG: hypothetical protein H0T89_07060 [Deltaproteobacteria bacterium]|nr:hypothetical protein [Deltaproteobacteria bacterium]MDQ3301439.1 DUF6209 family protein [Myxococcota bacterium]
MFVATALVTFGCADAPGPDEGGPGGKADGELTTLAFDDDWSETADGPLVAGLPIRIAYDLDRLTACRGSTNGSEVWAIGGHASFDGSTPVVFPVTRLANGRVVAVESELEIPARATSVELWFTNHNRWGCNAYDSNEGANYTFDIEQRANTAVAAFEADGSEDLPASVRAGDQLVLHYAPERLDECAASTAGNAAWSVTASYQVDGGTVKKLLVTRANGSELVAADPEITLPRGADLALWFEANNRYGCHVYDSNNGANYHLRID